MKFALSVDGKMILFNQLIQISQAERILQV